MFPRMFDHQSLIPLVQSAFTLIEKSLAIEKIYHVMSTSSLLANG